MLNRSTFDGIYTTGMENLNDNDQDQCQLIDYSGSTPSSVLVGKYNADRLHNVAMEEVMLHNNGQSESTCSWLMENYESSQGYSLPRCLIYEHYLDFCQRCALLPVNAASFGKTIRQVFPEIRTRRLGTRGQSKYHYYGIKVRCDSPYYSALIASQRMSLPYPTSGQWQAKTYSTLTPSPTNPTKTSASSMISTIGQSGGGGREGGTTGRSLDKGRNLASVTLQKDAREKTPTKGFTTNREPTLPLTPLMQPASNSLLPTFPTSRELVHLPPSIEHHQVNEFLKVYRDHCMIILEVIMRGGLDEVEYYCQTFWGSLQIEQRNLLEIPSICDALAVCDTYLYHTIVSVLIPGTLNTVPQSLLQGIRHFSYEVPRIMQNVLKPFSSQLMLSKMQAVKRFSQLLKRKTSLAHLAQATRSALTVDITITQMRQDWERRTEHDTVCSQLIWTMPQIKALKKQDIRSHMDSFKKLLESRASVEDHVKWVEEVRSFYVEKGGYPRDSVQYEKAERAFFMGWSHICGLIIRDQTLRSATSFGSFHLVNLLYEEYLLYVVETHLYQRDEVALWNSVMDLDKPMVDGYLLADIDLDFDDCDDILDMSTSSMMSMGAGDLFDDESILPGCSAVSVAPTTAPDKPVSTQSTYTVAKSPTSEGHIIEHKKPVLPKSDIISMAFAASTQSGEDPSPEPTGTKSCGVTEPSLAPLDSSVEPAGAVDLSSNATSDKQTGTSASEPSDFVTTKLIHATLLTKNDQKASNKKGHNKADEVLTDSPVAPQVLTLNVPVLPGLDLHKGQFLTAGDGNRYIINDVQTVVKPVKPQET
ncbi:transcription factor RFX4-like [Lytechinus variegatus]|uniref:transcription factor RFX4-like n=1 Tax=Lytechinus variegatus TaxID=7654 RepID=UPI001BB10F1D|nr:transcription factor RFX4-like [Lytechinus variegatus]